MPELDTQIRDYIDAMSVAITVEEILERDASTRLGDRSPANSRPMVAGGRVTIRRGLLIAAAAMVLVLGVIGLMSLLPLASEPLDPANPVSTTSPSPAPTTAPAIDATSLGRLELTAVDWPMGDYLSSGVWFNGSLYALGMSGSLYSTADGMSWIDSGLTSTGAGERASISVGDDSLVVLTPSPSDTIGSIECSQPGDFVDVSVLSTDGTWTSSKIEIPLDRPSTIAGCIHFRVGEAAAGTGGIMVAGSVSGELPFEAIIEEVLGEEVVNSITEVRPEGVTLVVSWQDGARTEVIDLEALGLAEEIAEYGAFARDLIGSEEGDNTWFGERPIMWFSTDGENWSQVEGTGGPMEAHQIEKLVATPDGGFIARTDSGGGFMTMDGSTWDGASFPQVDVFRRQGQLVVVGDGGVTPFLDPDQVLIPIPPEVAAEFRLYVGEMGVIGGGQGGYGYDFPYDQPFTFSTDGTVWGPWSPPEFDGLEGWVTLIGMGDEFVVFLDSQAQRLWVGTLEPSP